MSINKAKKKVKRVKSSNKNKVVSGVDKVVTVVVNGQVAGTVPENTTLAAAALQISRQHGLKSYSLKLDGTKLDTSVDMNQLLMGHKSIELFAKDSRG